ncbi:MAG: MMPL family transporter, partial [Bdellovibrionales bacterium]|nr:MMPL family transporter [Bdellovibrionales bacterium]
MSLSDRSVLFARSHFLTLAAILLLFLALLFAGGKLPATSGEVELLFPKNSDSLTAFQHEKQRFEDAYTDVIVLSLQGNSDIFVLDELEEELTQIPGIIAIQMPQENKAVNDLFGLKTKDKKHGRVILKIDPRLSEPQKAILNDTLHSRLKKFRELSPKRAGSFLTTQEVSKAVSEETARVIPWIIVSLVLSLGILFRSLRVTLVILCTTGLSLLSTLF